MRTHAGWWPLAYNLFHLFRRVIMVVLAIYAHKSPWLQTILFIITSEISCIYLFNVLPFDSYSQNRLEIINELLISTTGYCMAISCGWSMPADQRLYVGIVTVVFIFLTIDFNIARWISFTLKYAKMNLKR